MAAVHAGSPAVAGLVVVGWSSGASVVVGESVAEVSDAVDVLVASLGFDLLVVDAVESLEFDPQPARSTNDSRTAPASRLGR